MQSTEIALGGRVMRGRFREIRGKEDCDQRIESTFGCGGGGATWTLGP